MCPAPCHPRWHHRGRDYRRRGVPAIAAKSYRAERFHSRIVVEPGGSILVTETVRFEFGPDSFTYVFRDLPTRKTDGFTILSATMDGVPMERGKAPGQFELKREGSRRRIVWHFAATSNTAHVFSVTYRAAGGVWQDAGRDVLAWTLLPQDTNTQWPANQARWSIRLAPRSCWATEVLAASPGIAG